MDESTVRFLIAGLPEETSRALTAFAPLSGFRHEFSGFSQGSAHVLLLGIGGSIGLDAEAAKALARENPAAELLLLAPQDVALDPALLERANDVWRLPLDEAGLRFHFSRWQERFRQANELRRSKFFLQAVLDASPNLIWFRNRDGIHELVNASFCRAVGKTRQELEGSAQNWIAVEAGENVQCREPFCQSKEGAETRVSEQAIGTGEGQQQFTIYTSPLLADDGSLKGTLDIAVDVTKERRYQERLQEDNAALESIFTSMDCGILCHSLDGSRVISINRAALKLLDFNSLEEMESNAFQTVASTVDDEDKIKLRAAIGELKKVGDSTNYEYRVHHRDGNIVYIMGSARLMEKDGEIVCQRFLLDCTAQKLAEENKQNEQERSQRKLVRALSSDYQLVCLNDLTMDQGRVLQLQEYPDRELARILALDLPFPEKVEIYIETCVHPDDREGFRIACTPSALRNVLQHQETSYYNYRAINGDDILYFQLKAVRVGAPDEDFSVVVGLRSVDAQTRHEMEQKRQLATALKQANRASRAKTLFLSNMSHDIRTPMNAVVGYASLALAHLGQSEQVESYLQKILTSGNHLISLINDILDMSYIESGKIELDEKPQDLPAILKEVWNIVQPAASAKEQGFTLEVEDLRHERVLCDKLRLTQILLNLLSNSVKYTGKGGEIRMLVRELDNAAPRSAAYEIRISDNGIGMSEDFLPRIFQPFERAQTSTVAGVEGTGLGMTITKTLVDMMQGEIEVQSALDVGTEFVFRASFRLSEDAAGGNLTPVKAGRVLVAEPNGRDSKRLLRLLAANGLEADLATTESEALELLTPAKPYSLCLISQKFPGGAGALATQIKNLTGHARPFVAVIHENWAELNQNAGETPETGVDASLGKPIFWEDVRACLAAVENVAIDEAHTVPPASRPGHLLLAEDNPMNREIAVEFLTAAGYSVDVAVNGREAVEMIERSPAGTYDVVLMDVQMPVLDGYGAAQAIRALEDSRLASIPIIALTANSFEEDKQEALRRGMNGHIAKPIDFKILFQTLEQFLA